MVKENFLENLRKINKRYYDELAFNFYQLTLKNPCSTLVVTSCEKGGPSASLDLALAISSIRKVLLVDADFSRPQLHQEFNLPSIPGLLQMVTEDKNLGDIKRAIHQVEPNLNLLFSGCSSSSLEAFGHPQRLKSVFKVLQGDFNHVIVAAPPILSVPETTILNEIADKVILVIKAGKTRKEEAQKAKALINGEGSKLLGAILY